ncbi:MAG TPA: fluoride efflux transporter CrcB [Trueperaceae bacterium]|nr:fluoride efflux transporter CrcB [Trueperaceae bacterium]
MVVVGVMIGGSLGALARYATGQLFTGGAPTAPGLGLPLSTLVVNVAGSFLLGLITTVSAHGQLSPVMRTALGTGFVGAFTTFSTFELESDTLLREGHTGFATFYILGNLVFGYLALTAGRALGARLAAA